jgi:uncharacterized damage-inducible protein DinB
MDTMWKEILWQQFGASIDTLDNAMRACPETLWADRSRQPEFWHVAYHTLFFLDLYLAGSLDGFAPPVPFTLSELDPAGVLPERPYSKDELASYLAHCRKKCRTKIETLTDGDAGRRCVFPWLDLNFAELLLYSMRHVQHHAAQLNLILRRETGAAPRWVFQARSEESATGR